MYRRHEENSAFKNFKATNLQDDAKRLNDKDKAYYDEQNFVFGRNAHKTDICADA